MHAFFLGANPNLVLFFGLKVEVSIPAPKQKAEEGVRHLIVYKMILTSFFLIATFIYSKTKHPGYTRVLKTKRVWTEKKNLCKRIGVVMAVLGKRRGG